MKVLLINHGTQHSFHLAKQLNDKKILFKFYTGFAYTERSFYSFFHSFLFFLKRRLIIGVESDKLKTFPFLELFFLALLRIGIKSEFVLYIKSLIFQNLISNDVLLRADVIIGFDTCSWIISRRCKKLGKPFILEASIGHPVPKNKIFNELLYHFPDWGSGISLKKNYFIKYEEEEIENSSYISVPSSFVKSTYISMQVPDKKIVINPFGTNISHFIPKNHGPLIDNKINFLFFGALNARKGLPLLLKVWEQCSNLNCQLIIAGYGKIPKNIVLPSNVINAGSIHKADRIALFHNSDVFLFPSYFEGFALVLLEAAACGLPIISTDNAGAAEIVKNNVNGFIVNVGDELQLFNAIQFFINNPYHISKMGISSRNIAEKFTWEKYGQRWEVLLNNTHLNTLNSL
jgi:starch synthase